MRHASIAATALGLALGGLVAQSAGAAECKVDAVDAFQAAQQNGFEFVLETSTATSCDLTNSTLTVSSPNEHASKCVYRLLGGRPLAAPWVLTRLQVSGQGYSVSAVPPAPTTTVDANGQSHTVLAPQNGRLLSVTAPAGETTMVSVSMIVLSGPDCKRASEAFQ